MTTILRKLPVTRRNLAIETAMLTAVTRQLPAGEPRTRMVLYLATYCESGD